MRDPIKIAIVDDDDTFRRQTRALLESAEGIMIVREAQDEQGALDLARNHRPDVILLSLETCGPQAVTQIRKLSPGAQVIVWNAPGQEQLVLEAFRQGALGHLVKGQAQPDEIIRAIHIVSRGEAVLSPGMAGHILDEVIQNLRGAQ